MSLLEMRMRDFIVVSYSISTSTMIGITVLARLVSTFVQNSGSYTPMS